MPEELVVTIRLRVAVPVPLPRLFDYALAPGMATPQPGARVVIEFGRRKVVGIVIDVETGPVEGLKPILESLMIRR